MQATDFEERSGGTRCAPRPRAGLLPHAVRFRRLTDALVAFEHLWRPRPWHESRPAWCEACPALVRQLLALEDAAVERLAADDLAILGLLSAHLPGTAELAGLTCLAALPAVELREPGPHFDWHIPGRKREQVLAFCAAAGEPVAPVVDWCAGKGHLGRLIAAQWGVPVQSVDVDTALVADGEHLARRARQAGQYFSAADVTVPGAPVSLEGRHAVALHACGDLHRTLVRGVVEAGAAALDVAPCCHHKTAAARYESFSGISSLTLTPNELRLAVTGEATAPERERRERRRMNAWKLAWLELAGEGDAPRGLRPVPGRWLALGFEGFCRRLAEREGVALPAAADWQAVESAGWVRAARLARLSLPRFAFRRGLEVWLALDMALGIEAAGYAVRLGEFCPRQLTPRNLLLSARRG